MIGEVTNGLSQLTLTESCVKEVTRVVGFARDNVGTEKEALFKAFSPYIIASEFLQIARSMHPVRFVHVMPRVLFDEAEAKAVACVASSLLSQQTGNQSVSKKESGILWKVTVTDNAHTVVLLPKKGLFPDATGGNVKRGRISLVCHKEDTTWKTHLCWNLTSLKQKPADFFYAREVENALAKIGLSQFFATLHHD
ncbi:MAG: hypothetical protein LLF94_03360, partial [Chlamydiales bacterium]|nr:hypothetical protein [Chlamydiales bacterium]